MSETFNEKQDIRFPEMSWLTLRFFELIFENNFI